MIARNLGAIKHFEHTGGLEHRDDGISEGAGGEPACSMKDLQAAAMRSHGRNLHELIESQVALRGFAPLSDVPSLYAERFGVALAYHSFGRLVDFVRAVDTLATAELTGPALAAAGLKKPIAVVHLRSAGASAAPPPPARADDGRAGSKKGKGPHQGLSTPDSYEGQAAALQRKAERASKRAGVSEMAGRS